METFNIVLITGQLSRILKNFGTSHEFRKGFQVKFSLSDSVLGFQTIQDFAWWAREEHESELPGQAL